MRHDPADGRLRDGSRLSDLVRPDEGVISARAFTDPEIYQIELERIFLRGWVPVAHESEIPKLGDYATRSIGEDPVIVVRDQDERIRIFLNSCRHRGTELCRETMGNASLFRCAYHGFTYNTSGELVGVPEFTEAYGGKLDMSKLGLLEARVGVYGGLVFGTWNAGAPSLEEHLGDMCWYLDLLLRSTDRMVVAGPPHRWVVDANWKIGAENFIGDHVHLFVLHRSTFDVGMIPLGLKFYGYAVSVGNGHGLAIYGGGELYRAPYQVAPYLGLPQELWPQVERNLSREQKELLAKTASVHGNLFPNLAFLNAIMFTEEGGPPGNFLTMRLWIPKGPQRMEILSWLFLDEKSPEWYREASRRTYARTFGPGGTVESDDTETWVSLTRAMKGCFAQGNQVLNYDMGLGRKPACKEEWPYPGTAYYGAMTEANQRAFYRHWLDLLIRES
jgi:nitrite reductase/ring-hydroxylating ferredoxin subunit